MSRALSVDLRERVVAAIDGGLSCRAAGARFGVSAASAIRWRQLTLRTGKVLPSRQGGETRSGLIEAHHGFICSLIETNADLTLDEIRDALAARGASVSVASVWRFFDRHNITRKKRPRTPPSRSGPTSFAGAGPGSRVSSILILIDWCSSTRRGPAPTWHAGMAGADVVSGFAPAFPMATGKRRRSSPGCAIPA